MIVVDTGVLLGGADEDDHDHQRCARLLRDRRAELCVPAPVVVETCWQLERNLGPSAESRFLRTITDGVLEVIALNPDHYARCTELIETYADLRLGLVDASVVAVAERLGITSIATLNHRDFMVVRPRHVDAFELLP